MHSNQLFQLAVYLLFYPKKHPTRYIFTGVYSRGEKGPARLQKFARDIGADFIPIELTVKKEVLISRCDTSERRKRKKLSDRKKYSNFVEDWMSGAYHSRHVNKLVLDSSEQTAEETFKLVKKYLKKFD
jgi:hypothetical protein